MILTLSILGMKNDSNLPRIAFVGDFPRSFNKFKSLCKSETGFDKWGNSSFYISHGNNRGNLVWQESVFRIFSYNLSNSKCLTFDELHQNKEGIDDQFDFIIINLACWINNIFFRPSSFISNLKLKKCKAICLGNGCMKNNYIKSNPDLSKKDFHPSVMECLQWMSDNAEVFSVRGEETRKTLKDIFNIDSIALGCPSAYSFPDSINNISLKPFETSSLAVADYLQRYTKGNPIFLEKFSSFKFVNYFCQSNYQLDGGSNIEFPIDFNLDEVLNVKINECDGSLKNYPFQIKGVDKIYAPNNVDNWRGVLSMHDYYIGTRLHCAMLSLQAGIFPFIFYDDERPLEVANLIGLPHLNSKNINNFDLKNVFSKVNLKNFKKQYNSKLNTFKERLSKEGLVLYK